MAQTGVLRVAERPRYQRRRERRRRIVKRTLPLLLLAGVAFAVGFVLVTKPNHDERKLVTNYLNAWDHGDYAGMYALLAPASRAQLSEARFRADYLAAEHTATLLSVSHGRVRDPQHNVIAVPMVIHTRLFGTLHENVEVSLLGSGSSAGVEFGGTLLFPGLRTGERLHRVVALPPRAPLIASDGTPLAEGPQRTSPLPNVAGQIVGTLGRVPAAERATYAAHGYPPNAQVGQDGLELVFQSRLAGKPGGVLLAGHRVLARVAAVPGKPVRTTINPTIEEAAIAAMGSSYAGIIAMDPRTGGLLGAAGIAYSDLQPPGSTMKIITVSAALTAGVAKPTTVFPYATQSDVGGYILQNAGGEDCGGTLVNAFAVSCNSVFAPLGVTLGGARLVAMAERFGFNHPTGIPGAVESTIPSAATIGSATAVGSSAIGQGKVQASPLEMAEAGATIAMGGRRPLPTLLDHQAPRFVPVISSQVASEVQQMMIAVVQYGTGTAAQIPGVTVAGKTGTAELVDTAAPGASTPQNTDAWFVGYAPVGNPRIVVAALFPNQGAGGATAAPAVRQVLLAALQSTH